MNIRVCDLIADFIAKKNVDHVFMVSGGGLLFLTDGLYQCQKLKAVCCHHEQAAAMAAVGYAKYKGFGCAYVTTGCGGTNSVTGVLNAWQDNTSCMFISGQCKRKETIRYRNLNIRQLGVQEADIVSIVEPITKYAVMLDDPQKTLYELEKAYFLAKEGRPGPVWIDVPMDVQSAWIETDDLPHYPQPAPPAWNADLSALRNALAAAERPILLVGGGVRLSGTQTAFQSFVEQYHLPFVCSRMGTDVLPTTHPLNIGRIGNKGTRGANLALQNADLVLVLGSRLSVSSTGQEYPYFVRGGKVHVVDIDAEEHKKQTVHIDAFYHMDLRCFFRRIGELSLQNISSWTERCVSWREKYPVCQPEYYHSELVNLYVFMEELSELLRPDSVVVGDAGSAVYVPPQALKTTENSQRYITSGGQAEMGFTLPAAIGISAARRNQEVLAITGDGSLQMNIQELQTLKYYQFPVKLFVWNNNGYLSIRASQSRMFDGRKIGTDASNGLSFPDLRKLAEAYGIKYVNIPNTAALRKGLRKTLAYNEPVICEVMCIPDQPIVPSVSSRQLEDGTLISCPLEDMSPFLPRDEFKREMIVKPIGDEHGALKDGSK